MAHALAAFDVALQDALENGPRASAATQVVAAAGQCCDALAKIVQSIENLRQQAKKDRTDVLCQLDHLLGQLADVQIAPDKEHIATDPLLRNLAALLSLQLVERPSGHFAVFSASGIALVDSGDKMFSFLAPERCNLIQKLPGGRIAALEVALTQMFPDAISRVEVLANDLWSRFGHMKFGTQRAPLFVRVARWKDQIHSTGPLTLNPELDPARCGNPAILMAPSGEEDWNSGFDRSRNIRRLRQALCFGQLPFGMRTNSAENLLKAQDDAICDQKQEIETRLANAYARLGALVQFEKGSESKAITTLDQALEVNQRLLHLIQDANT